MCLSKQLIFAANCKPYDAAALRQAIAHPAMSTDEKLAITRFMNGDTSERHRLRFCAVRISQFEQGPLRPSPYPIEPPDWSLCVDLGGSPSLEDTFDHVFRPDRANRLDGTRACLLKEKQTHLDLYGWCCVADFEDSVTSNAVFVRSIASNLLEVFALFLHQDSGASA